MRPVSLAAFSDGAALVALSNCASSGSDSALSAAVFMGCCVGAITSGRSTNGFRRTGLLKSPQNSFEWTSGQWNSHCVVPEGTLQYSLRLYLAKVRYSLLASLHSSAVLQLTGCAFVLFYPLKYLQGTTIPLFTNTAFCRVSSGFKLFSIYFTINGITTIMADGLRRHK